MPDHLHCAKSCFILLECRRVCYSGFPLSNSRKVNFGMVSLLVLVYSVSKTASSALKWHPSLGVPNRAKPYHIKGELDPLQSTDWLTFLQWLTIPNSTEQYCLVEIWLVCLHVCTWIMEAVADHSKTGHCLMGSVVPQVFCSLCQILLRAGT